MNHEERVFQPTSLVDELRALLRDAYSAEDLARMSGEELERAATTYQLLVTRLRRGREFLAEDVASGRLSQAEADSLQGKALLEYVDIRTTLSNLRHSLEGPISRKAVATEPPREETLRAEQIIASFCDLLAIVKAQQNIIQDLTNDRDVFLAHFTDRMFDKVQSSLKDGRDYKGISITLKLSDETTESKERTQAQTDETSAMQSALRDINGEINVLAKQLGGLALGRRVHNEELNKRIATVSKTTRAAASAKWKGEASIQIAEVTANRKGTE